MRRARCTSRTTSASASTRRTRTSWTARCGTWRTRPPEKRPLLLHYHPLVIYRFQVLKQADVVLALFLQGDHFTARGEARRLRVLRPDHHRRLDAVGGGAVDHRRRGRLPRSRAAVLLPARCSSTWPTCTTTPPTACTSPRPAGSGARWSTASAGCATTTACITFDPRLPEAWTRLTFRITLQRQPGPGRSDRRGRSLLGGRGGSGRGVGPRPPGQGVSPMSPVRVPLSDQGSTESTGRRRSVTSDRRSDGTVISASVPQSGYGPPPLTVGTGRSGLVSAPRGPRDPSDRSVRP